MRRLGAYAAIRGLAVATGVPTDLRAKHPVDLVADVQDIYESFTANIATSQTATPRAAAS